MSATNTMPGKLLNACLASNGRYNAEILRKPWPVEIVSTWPQLLSNATVHQSQAFLSHLSNINIATALAVVASQPGLATGCDPVPWVQGVQGVKPVRNVS